MARAKVRIDCFYALFKPSFPGVHLYKTELPDNLNIVYWILNEDITDQQIQKINFLYEKFDKMSFTLFVCLISVCSPGSFGTNCAQTCACNASNTAICNTVSGACTCKSGWDGTTCDLDVNECLVTSGLCGALKTCTNTPGSHVCSCIAGYTINSDDVCIGNISGQRSSWVCLHLEFYAVRCFIDRNTLSITIFTSTLFLRER